MRSYSAEGRSVALRAPRNDGRYRHFLFGVALCFASVAHSESLIQKPELRTITINGTVVAPQIDPKIATTEIGKGPVTAPAPAAIQPVAPPQQEVSVEFDDAATRKTSSLPPIPKNAAGGGGGSQIEMLKDFFPMCVFIDPSVPNGNQIVKEMVDMAADKCKVNLLVEPYYIEPNYPQTSAQLTDILRKKCNAVTGFKGLGANRANVTLLTGNSQLPLEMCNAKGASPIDKFGCSEVGYPVPLGQELRMRNVASYGGVAPPGQSSVSIIGPFGLSADKISGIALGQGMMSAPPGAEGGNGVGGWYEGSAGPRMAPTPGWKDAGCEMMRKNAFRNERGIAWKRDQQEYVASIKPRMKLLDITDKRPLFSEATQKNAGSSGSPATSQSVARAPASPLSGGGPTGHPFGKKSSDASGKSVSGAEAPSGRGNSLRGQVSDVYGEASASASSGDSLESESGVTKVGRAAGNESIGFNDSRASDTPLSGSFFSQVEIGNKNGSGGASSEEEELKKRQLAAIENPFDASFFKESEENDKNASKRGDSLRKTNTLAPATIY